MGAETGLSALPQGMGCEAVGQRVFQSSRGQLLSSSEGPLHHHYLAGESSGASLGSAYLRGSLCQTLLGKSLLFCGHQPWNEGELEPCAPCTGHGGDTWGRLSWLPRPIF